MTEALKIQYPDTPKSDHKDTLHGVEIADPFRWLEDLNSHQTKKWIREQNQLTQTYLTNLSQRDTIAERLKNISDFDMYVRPMERGGKWFYYHKRAKQNSFALYFKHLDQEQSKLLIHPEELSFGKEASIKSIRPSDDGEYVAYGLSHKGLDWQQWRIRHVETGLDTPEVLTGIKFPFISWTPDHKGFFYCRFDQPYVEGSAPETLGSQKLCYHRLFTPQDTDEVIFEQPKGNDWLYTARVTADGQHLIIVVSEGKSHNNLIFRHTLGQENSLQSIVNRFEANYFYIGNIEDQLFFRTDHSADKGQIVAINRQNGKMTTIVGEKPMVLESASLVGQKLIGIYYDQALSIVKVFSTIGQEIETVKLPDLGTAVGFESTPFKETYFSFTSFHTPPQPYMFSIKTSETKKIFDLELSFKPEDFVIERVEYPTEDGTNILMFLLFHQDQKDRQDLPALLYGYGGFNVSMTPTFRADHLVFAQAGGIVGIPCVRGGGEFGKSWHEAGSGLNKQNSFDDFIAAAEWLKQTKRAHQDKIAITGRSNGGLLVAGSFIKRPDLFKAAVPAVGVYDMLRFHQFTIGWAWQAEYGDIENQQDFKNLLEYSPLHNLGDQSKYPATLVISTENDDRVYPAHSYKFAATLQSSTHQGTPKLIRIDPKSGHGRSGRTRYLEEAGDALTFIFHHLGMNI